MRPWQAGFQTRGLPRPDSRDAQNRADLGQRCKRRRCAAAGRIGGRYTVEALLVGVPYHGLDAVRFQALRQILGFGAGIQGTALYAIDRFARGRFHIDDTGGHAK